MFTSELSLTAFAWKRQQVDLLFPWLVAGTLLSARCMHGSEGSIVKPVKIQLTWLCMCDNFTSPFVFVGHAKYSRIPYSVLT